MNAKTPDEQIEAANAQTSALARLLVVVENYPQLKSDANFQRLMDELAGTENRIAVARQRYNDSARQDTTRCAAASRRTSPPRCSASRNTPITKRRPRRSGCRRSTSASKRATTSSRRLTYNSGARTRSLRAPRESARTFSVPRGSRAGCGGIQPPLHSITSGVARLTAAAPHTDAAEVAQGEAAWGFWPTDVPGS